ncbi:MAG TPA: flagellar FlbD family protein [Terracidiphilus sp.]|jgi:flagellar protein FlbD|nr:flagellar FlbD family protein [Terracidiphilus sp.]
MIQLTKLNGTTMVLNSDLIKTAEASPDTMLTLINGEKLIVREPISEIVEAILVYRARLLASIAQHMPESGRLTRTASLTSLDFTNCADEATNTVKQLSGSCFV